MAQTVAFVFSDIEGSTRLLAMLGAERYGDILASYRSTLERIAATEGGKVVDQEGDGLFLVFPTAAAALRAAVGAQQAIARQEWPEGSAVHIRMGVHAGEAERLGDGWIGLAVHRAARIASVAHGGQVLVSEAAKALSADELPASVGLHDLGSHRLKDLERGEHLYQLRGPQLRTDFPPVQTLGTVPNNLPLQPTTFIGRRRELAEVAGLLERERLVTLTGVGGVGKSRLAFQAAAQALGHYRDGVWVVELAPLASPDALVGMVAAVLGIREDNAESATGGAALQQRLIEHLAERQTLLVLDNCEHLLDEASRLVDTLLRACPELRILATSREGLGVAGETTWRVPSLGTSGVSGESTAVDDAVQLFAERARAVLPSFALSPAILPAVVQICRRLDGIPLAIELAAARTGVLAVDQLAERLDDRFRLLTGGSRTALPRQQTLEAAVDWSYQLLSEEERVLFGRVSVFAGGFTLDAAEAVCAGGVVAPSDVLELVFHLVDKSLVSPLEGPAGPVRYRMLETLRQYGATKLAHSGEGEAVRNRHRDWFAGLAGQVRAELPARAPQRWLVQLQEELDNVRAAYEWATETDTRAQASITAAALGAHYGAQGQYSRAAEYLRSALAQQADPDPTWEAELRFELSLALMNVGEADAALAEIARARDLVAVGGPSPTRVRVLARHASMLRSHVRHAPAEAIEPATQAVAEAEQIGDPALLSFAFLTLGSALAWTGDVDVGVAHLRDALRAAREADDPLAIGRVYLALAVAIHHFGHREDEADRLFTETRSWLESLPDQPAWTFDLWGQLCYFHLRRGEWPEVERLLQRITQRFNLEGFDRAWLLQVRGALRWMQGRLAEAQSDADELQDMRIARWNHDLYPLLAEVAAADRRLDDVRAVAAEYLAQDVDASEQAMKVAVLAPLARAEVDAALVASGNSRDAHLARAREAVRQAEELVERHRPLTSGGIQFETPHVQLLIARAELSRASDGDRALWRRVIEEAWYAYTRLYARWRLAEAELLGGQLDEARSQLLLAHREASERGARLIRSELAALAERADLELGQAGELSVPASG